MRALFAVAALLAAASAAEARTVVVEPALAVTEARWCTAQAVFVDVAWDCRYPTRAICEAYAPHDRACLINPNWSLYHRSLRR